MTSELRSALRDAFDRLKADHAASPDWHPSTNEMVQDLVHPSMYPLVYGRTRIFEDECVGLDDAVRKWAGKGEMILREDWKYVVGRDRYKPAMGGGLIPNEFWSDNYQWLPANVAFTENGGVKFTSYINNLHPNKYPEIYRTIEKLVETSLPMWDQCLGIREGINAGRKDPRIANPDSCE